jgi:hypothetical protein
MEGAVTNASKGRGQFAIVTIGSIQADQHIVLRLAAALDGAALRYVGVREWRE